MQPRCCRPATSWVHYTTSCNSQASAPEDGQNNFPKHVELTGIIKEPLLLHLAGCLYYLYQWCTVKQISENEIYLLIKYLKSILLRVAKRLSYIEDAWCLKVKYVVFTLYKRTMTILYTVTLSSILISRYDHVLRFISIYFLSIPLLATTKAFVFVFSLYDFAKYITEWLIVWLIGLTDKHLGFSPNGPDSHRPY